ncbi:MAG: molybdopterin molybdotransferase MoeA [Candidatus Hermodarchaeota archaeon]
MKFEDIRLKGFSKRLKLQDAIKKSLMELPSFPSEEIDLKTTSIANRIVAQEIHSKRTIPPFNRSAVDGYAVKASDTIGATESTPVILKIIDELQIGQVPKISLETGKTIQIPTGGVIPDGADAVIMVEDTEKLPESNDIEIFVSIHPGKNVAKAGEDLEENELLFKAGRKLKAVDRAFLLSAGIKTIKTSIIPKIAIFSTGNELIEAWKDQIPLGRIPDVNSVNLFELCLKERWHPEIKGIIPDEESRLKQAILDSTQMYDVLLFTGGSSVGEKDYIPIILNDIGRLIFHGIAMRPGGPVCAACIDNAIIFGLPGFPAAALISFQFLVKPVLYSLMGMDSKNKPLIIDAKVSRNVGSKLGRLDFLRVRLEKDSSGNRVAIPIQIGGSGLLKTLVQGNGIIPIPESSEGLKKDDIVDVVVLDADYMDLPPWKQESV